MSAVLSGWGFRGEPRAGAGLRKPPFETCARENAGDLVELVLTGGRIPTRDELMARGMARATAIRWRNWLAERFAGRFS